jgi:murein DD-endopeptidase MepM/ murein hydrolase activator NlpD
MSSDAESAYGRRFFKRSQSAAHANNERKPLPLPQQHSTSLNPQTSSPLPTDINAITGSAGARVLTHTSWNDAKVRPEADGVSSTMFSQLQLRIQHTLADQVTPLRLASHLSVVFVAAVVLLFSRISMPDWDFQLVAMPTASSGFESVSQQVTTYLSGQSMTGAEDVTFQPQIVPFTIIPEKTRQEVQAYSVQAGDTVLGIASKFKLRPETIQWSNPAIEQNPDLLRIGDQLNILPVDGVLYTVRAGDTLSSLASRFKITADQIVAFEANGLADASTPLVVGDQIVLPGGIKPAASPRQAAAAYTATTAVAPSDALKGSGAFGWPTSGSISQNYWGGHPAIDIASRTGASVKAADDGYVVLAGGGWNGGYGNHVIIDHGNGFTTLYAHMNTIFVKAGENVSMGQQIGTVGNTGNSTGPHLHFEIRYQGYPRNPYSFLP